MQMGGQFIVEERGTVKSDIGKNSALHRASVGTGMMPECDRVVTQA
jgi:hypothetical protein